MPTRFPAGLAIAGRTTFALALIAGLLACNSAASEPQRYLASITGFELRDGEGIDAFSIDTWGVTIKAVCHVPGAGDWEIFAGRFGTVGRIDGQAGHGTSWIRAGHTDELHDLVLIELSGPVQPRKIGNVPPTFAGSATILSSDDGREMPLGASNVKLQPANQCPPLSD